MVQATEIELNYRMDASQVAHTGLFIPSTLNGSCMQSSNGKVNEQKLKENLSDAIDVYI